MSCYPIDFPAGLLGRRFPFQEEETSTHLAASRTGKGSRDERENDREGSKAFEFPPELLPVPNALEHILRTRTMDMLLARH
jgi:hypothetical protein